MKDLIGVITAAMSAALILSACGEEPNDLCSFNIQDADAGRFNDPAPINDNKIRVKDADGTKGPSQCTVAGKEDSSARPSSGSGSGTGGGTGGGKNEVPTTPLR